VAAFNDARGSGANLPLTLNAKLWCILSLLLLAVQSAAMGQANAPLGKVFVGANEAGPVLI